MQLEFLKFNPFAKSFDRYMPKFEEKQIEQINKNAQGLSQEDLDSIQYESQLGYSNIDNILISNIDFDQLFKDKLSRISKYKEMSMYPEIGVALDYVCDEGIYENEEGEIATLEFVEDLPRAVEKKLRDIFEYFTYDVLDLQNNGWKFFRKFVIESEIYLEMVMDSSRKNIIGFKELPSYSMVPLYRGSVVEAYKQSVPNVKSDKIRNFAKNQIGYANFGQFGKTRVDIRGYLEPAIRLYNQLRNLEDSLIVYRLVRAPERRIWNIATGKMPKGKAEQYIQNLIRKYKQKAIYNSETGKVDSAANIQSMNEDYWFAKREDGQGTTVEQITGGMNLGEITDVNYFLEKLYKVLKLPRNRWDNNMPGMASLGRSGEMMRDEIKFTNFVQRCQNLFKPVIMDPFLTLAKMRGVDEQYLRSDLFKLTFSQNSLFKEIKELEANQEKLNILSTATAFVSSPMNKSDPNAIFAKEFAVKNIYKMSDEDYALNEKLKKKEEEEAKANQEENGFGFGDQFGGNDQFGGGGEQPQGDEAGPPPLAPEEEEIPPDFAKSLKEEKKPREKKKLIVDQRFVEFVRNYK